MRETLVLTTGMALNRGWDVSFHIETSWTVSFAPELFQLTAGSPDLDRWHARLAPAN